jgi:signal transduction histidine kinase
VNPKNDTLEHMASYIGQYAEEYFQMTGISCELDIPTQLAPQPIPSQMRHQLFLATHEAFTNILKHSGATHAKVSMTFHDSDLEIHISDDGRGFNFPEDGRMPAASATGDGLSNMTKRLADIGGQCLIQSRLKQGTHIRFRLSFKLLAHPNGH